MKMVDYYKQKNSIKDKLAFLVGVLCTMPILGVPLGGRYITLFSLVFVLFFAITAFSAFLKAKGSFHVTNSRKTYLLFLVWPILSYLVGLFYMPSEWHASMTSYIVRALEYLVLTLLLYMNDDENTSIVFSKGLIVGIAANAVWSIFEAISWYFLKRSLNDLLFGRFLNIGRDIIIWNRYGGGIRVCGLNYDPAHLGGILPILLCYGLMRGNAYVIVLSLVSLAFSQSTTALLGCVVVFIVFLVVKKKKPKNLLRISTNKIIVMGVGLLCVILAIAVLGSGGRITSFVSSISENVNGYFTRVNTVYVGSTNTSEPRRVYYTQALDKLFERGPIVSIMGSGLGTSMYPFRNVSGLFSSGAQSTVTEIETNYIAYLFDLGVIGLVFYILLLAKGVRKFGRNIRKRTDASTIVFFASFVSIIVCSATYHYIFTAYHMLIFSFTTVYIDSLVDDKVKKGAD